MKSLVIIIPGSRPRSSPLLNTLFSRFYSYFGVDMGHDKWVFELKKLLEKDSNVKIFHWQGGISRFFSIKPAAKRLVKFVNSLKGYDKIILFGKSLGAIVAEIAISEINTKISKLIYVATPHKSSKVKIPRNIEIINIYSNKDKYQNLANIFLNFGFGKRKLTNAKNIALNNLKHSDFNKNTLIKFKEKEIKLFNFYKKIILK